VQVVAAAAGRKLRYIFGADDRTQTSSIATAYPFRTVGQVNMQGSGGNRYTCSGATVGPRAVLTAGHCVHSGPGGSGWYNVQFSAGRSCSTCNPYGTLQWSWITTYRAWVSGGAGATVTCPPA
jgi:V8-like Glu-specific endopeptidase